MEDRSPKRDLADDRLVPFSVGTDSPVSAASCTARPRAG